MLRPRLLYTIALVCALVFPVAAQTATISGTITDQSDAAVPGATVTLDGPGGTRTAVSGSRGEVQLPQRRQRHLQGHGDAPRVRAGDARRRRQRIERRGAGDHPVARQPDRHDRRQRVAFGYRADRRAGDDERWSPAKRWRARRRRTTATCCARVPGRQRRSSCRRATSTSRTGRARRRCPTRSWCCSTAARSTSISSASCCGISCQRTWPTSSRSK